MSKPINRLYEFGDFRLETAERLLLHNEKPVSLTPRAFDTLLALIDNSGQLVAKDELMKQVWGDAFVEEANLARNIWTLRKALHDDEREHRYIETVPKRGYRFTAPVRELPNDEVEVLVRRRIKARLITEEENSEDGKGGSPTSGIEALTQTIDLPWAVESSPLGTGATLVRPAQSRWSRRRIVVISSVAICGLAALLVAIFFSARSSGRPAGSARTIQSIAVLPFVNGSNDPELEYLSDGITENVINRLSQAAHLKMIARSSVYRYKGKEIDPQKVGRELGVQAILTGRVVQQADNLFVSAELVDVTDNSHLWGEQYNRKSTDLAFLQKELAQDIANGLRPGIHR